jgi:hypothetical protein
MCVVPAEYMHVFRMTIKIKAELLFVIYIVGQYNVKIIVQPFAKDQTPDAEFTARCIHIRNKRTST